MLVEVKSFKVAMLNFHGTLGNDSDTDDEKGNHSPPAKRQKLECIAMTSGSPSLSNKGCNQDEKCLPFLLTSVRGIGPEFNARNTAIGIKGMCPVFF